MTTMNDNEARSLSPADEKTHSLAFTNPNTDPNTLEIDHVAEKKLVRKLDMWIVPPVMLLYLFSFLDRVNIGNARLYGLEEDLGMSGNQSLRPLITSALLNASAVFEYPDWRSLRTIISCFSSGVRYLAVSGSSASHHQAAIPRTMVGIPSIILFGR